MPYLVFSSHSPSPKHPFQKVFSQSVKRIRLDNFNEIIGQQQKKHQNFHTPIKFSNHADQSQFLSLLLAIFLSFQNCDYSMKVRPVIRPHISFLGARIKFEGVLAFIIGPYSKRNETTLTKNGKNADGDDNSRCFIMPMSPALQIPIQALFQTCRKSKLIISFQLFYPQCKIVYCVNSAFNKGRSQGKSTLGCMGVELVLTCIY